MLDVNAFERLLGPCKDLMERAIGNYADEVANVSAWEFLLNKIFKKNCVELGVSIWSKIEQKTGVTNRSGLGAAVSRFLSFSNWLIRHFRLWNRVETKDITQMSAKVQYHMYSFCSKRADFAQKGPILAFSVLQISLQSFGFHKNHLLSQKISSSSSKTQIWAG